jgi:hypothetical protein
VAAELPMCVEQICFQKQDTAWLREERRQVGRRNPPMAPTSLVGKTSQTRFLYGIPTRNAIKKSDILRLRTCAPPKSSCTLLVEYNTKPQLWRARLQSRSVTPSSNPEAVGLNLYWGHQEALLKHR